MKRYCWLAAPVLTLALCAPTAWAQSPPQQDWLQSFVDGWVKTLQAILQAPTLPDNELVCPAGVNAQSTANFPTYPEPRMAEGELPQSTLFEPKNDGEPRDIPVHVRDTTTGSLMFGAGINSNTGITSCIATSEPASEWRIDWSAKHSKPGLAQHEAKPQPDSASCFGAAQSIFVDLTTPSSPTQFGVDQPSGRCPAGVDQSDDVAGGSCCPANGAKAGCCAHCSCKSCTKGGVNFPFLNLSLLDDMSAADLATLRDQIGLLCQARQMQELAMLQLSGHGPHGPVLGMGCPMMAHPAIVVGQPFRPVPMGWVPPPPMGWGGPNSQWANYPLAAALSEITCSGWGGPNSQWANYPYFSPELPLPPPGMGGDWSGIVRPLSSSGISTSFSDFPPPFLPPTQFRPAPNMPYPPPGYAAYPPMPPAPWMGSPIMAHPPLMIPGLAQLPPAPIMPPACPGADDRPAEAAAPKPPAPPSEAPAPSGTPVSLSNPAVVTPARGTELKMLPQPARRARADETGPPQYQIDARNGSIVLTMPNLHARCQRMTYVGGGHDRVLLEGDVHILSQKNGENTRIDASRITVDLIRGTFTVESGHGSGPANANPNVGLGHSPVPPTNSESE